MRYKGITTRKKCNRRTRPSPAYAAAKAIPIRRYARQNLSGKPYIKHGKISADTEREDDIFI